MYDVRIVYPADVSLDAIPDAAFAEVDDRILLLARYPEMGRLYDPLYEAARVDAEMRVIYVGYYGIYYTVDRERQIVRVRFIEDQRMDPETRFTGRLQ